MNDAENIQARPFVKWVGGKRSILPELIARMPETCSHYYEPFVGGGALFFAACPVEGPFVHLSDKNLRLMATYAGIRDYLPQVVDFLKQHRDNHCLEYYRQARVRLSKSRDIAEVASLFIYLNKTCYNGLYRVNKAGGFNVPMGKYKDPPILDEENLVACSKKLQGVELTQRSVFQTLGGAGAFYYLDPPYDGTYDSYTADGFDEHKQKLLAQYCHKIDKRGSRFMLSNSDTPLIRELYARYNIAEVFAGRYVSSRGDGRGRTQELLITNY